MPAPLPMWSPLVCPLRPRSYSYGGTVTVNHGQVNDQMGSDDAR
ncbi:hypothetical protein ABGB07_08525 [Micromonosporaceae bacterium B7E4]